MDAIEPELEEQEQNIHLMSVVPIVLIPTNTVPIDFVMLLVAPFHKKFKTIEISDKERAGFNRCPVEVQGGGEDDGSEDGSAGEEEEDGGRRKQKKGGKGKGKLRGKAT